MATLKVAESWFKMDKKKMLEELKLMKESQRMTIAVKMAIDEFKMEDLDNCILIGKNEYAIQIEVPVSEEKTLDTYVKVKFSCMNFNPNKKGENDPFVLNKNFLDEVAIKEKEAEAKAKIKEDKLKKIGKSKKKEVVEVEETVEEVLEEVAETVDEIMETL